MSGRELLWVAAGLAVLALVLYDIFATILHHWGGAGPLSGRVAHGIWRVSVGFTSRLEAGRRRRVLGKVGPLLIPFTVILWAGLVVLGFAFLYLPWMPGSFHAGESIPSLRGLADAVYYSGVTFFTVGYGDIVPLSTGLRLLSMLQGGSGFALITLVVSYFTSVYGAYSKQKTTAESVYYQAGLEADAARIIVHHLADGAPASALAGEAGRLRDGLASIRSDYGSYPLLHYFVSSRAEQSLVRLLFVVQELVLLLDTAVDPEGCPGAAGLGSRSGLRHAADAVRDGVVETLLRRAPETVKEGDPSGEELAAWEARFDRARRELRSAGVPVREDAEAVREYCRRRGEWEPVLRATARALGESWKQVAQGA